MHMTGSNRMDQVELADMSLATVVCALTDRVEAIGGIEKAIIAASAVYGGVYAYPARRAVEVAQEHGCTLNCIAQDIRSRWVTSAFQASLDPVDQARDDFGGGGVGWSVDEDDSQLDFAREVFEQECAITAPVINPDTMVACLCNYKGEDGGAGVFALAVEGFLVFHGKYDYR